MPPIYAKQALSAGLLQATRDDAKEAVSAADRLVFFGYSLPSLDVEAEKLFERSIQTNTNLTDIDVINPQAPRRRAPPELRPNGGSDGIRRTACRSLIETCDDDSLLLRGTDAGVSTTARLTIAKDETRKLRRHVAGSCIRCGTSISTAWRRVLRCAASARHDYGPLHARTDPATLCSSAREDISREFP
jgi:hypothetical protein